MFPYQPNKSVIDVFTVLQAIIESEEPIGSRQLSRDLGLDHTRVNRLVKTLAGLGFVKQNERRKYAAGPGIHVLAAQSLHASLSVRAALPELETLSRETNLAVALGVIWRSKVSYFYNSTYPESTFAESVGASKAHVACISGIGVILLSELTDEEIKILHPDVPEAAKDNIELARKQGWFLITRMKGETKNTLAVSIGNGVGLGLSGDISKDDVKVLLPKLMSAAARIKEKVNSTSR